MHGKSVETPKRLKGENLDIVMNKSLVEILSGRIHDKASKVGI